MFGKLAAKAVEAVLAGGWRDGLPPMLVHPNSGAAPDHAGITLGARGDSYLECKHGSRLDPISPVHICNLHTYNFGKI